MKLHDSFDIDANIETVWGLLNDVPRVAPCIPNASITGVIDANTYEAAVGVKVGPVAVNYKASITVIERDDALHRVVLQIRGTDTKGRGGVTATATAVATATEQGTHVALETDAAISGIVATVC